MAGYRPLIAPPVAERIRSLAPELKRAVGQAIQSRTVVIVAFGHRRTVYEETADRVRAGRR